MFEDKVWKFLLVVIIFIRPVSYLLNGTLEELLLPRWDSKNHLSYTRFLFFDQEDFPYNMANYPTLFPTLIYFFSLGRPELIANGLILLAALSMVLHRIAIVNMLRRFRPAVKFAIANLVIEFPYQIPFIRRVLFGTTTFIHSLEMYSIWVGTIPSFIAFSLGMLGLMHPTVFPVLALIATGLSDSASLIITFFGLLGFAKTKRWLFLSPILINLLIQPTQFISLMSSGVVLFLANVIPISGGGLRHTILALMFLLMALLWKPEKVES